MFVLTPFTFAADVPDQTTPVLRLTPDRLSPSLMPPPEAIRRLGFLIFLFFFLLRRRVLLFLLMPKLPVTFSFPLPAFATRHFGAPFPPEELSRPFFPPSYLNRFCLSPLLMVRCIPPFFFFQDPRYPPLLKPKCCPPVFPPACRPRPQSP